MIDRQDMTPISPNTSSGFGATSEGSACLNASSAFSAAVGATVSVAVGAAVGFSAGP